MFKKSNRLSKSEFSEYFRTGNKKHFPHLTIIRSKEEEKTKVLGKDELPLETDSIENEIESDESAEIEEDESPDI